MAGRADTHRSASIATALALTLGLGACGGGSGPGSKTLHLTIGNVLPQSGIDRQLGESGEKASALALSRIRQASGAVDADHTVRAIQQDQGPDATSATDAARTLVDGRGASCLTGPWSSDAVAQVANHVTIPAKALEISPVPTGNDISELSDHDLVDSTALPVSLEGAALSKAIEQDLGSAQGRTVNVAAAASGYGDAVTQDFTKDWQDKDGTVGGRIVLPPLATSSTGYSAQASQLLSNAPDAVAVIDDPVSFAQLAPALSSNPAWDAGAAWGGDRLVSPGLPGLVGRQAVDGMRALAPGSPQGAAATAAFDSAFQAAAPHDVKMAPYAAQEFDATVLCYLAAVAAGSTDGQEMADHLIDITAPGGPSYTWQQLPEAIKALEDGKDIDYTGASGPIDMDVHGDPTTGVFDVYRYSGGRLEVAGEVPVQQPNPATP